MHAWVGPKNPKKSEKRFGTRTTTSPINDQIEDVEDSQSCIEFSQTAPHTRGPIVGHYRTLKRNGRKYIICNVSACAKLLALVRKPYNSTGACANFCFSHCIGKGYNFTHAEQAPKNTTVHRC